MKEILKLYDLCREVFNNVYEAAIENQENTDKPEAFKFLADAYENIVFPWCEKVSSTQQEYNTLLNFHLAKQQKFRKISNTFAMLKGLYLTKDSMISMLPIQSFEIAETDISCAINLALLVSRELDLSLNFLKYAEEYLFMSADDPCVTFGVKDVITADDHWGRESLPDEGKNIYQEVDFEFKLAQTGAGLGGIIIAIIAGLIFNSWGGIIGGGLAGCIVGAIAGNAIGKKRNEKFKREQKWLIESTKERNEKKRAKAERDLKNSLSYGFAEKIFEMREPLLQVMQIYSDVCAKILNHSAFSAIPKQYLGDVQALEAFHEYFEGGRVDNLKEAINLYIAEMRERERHEEMQQLERERIENEKRAQEALLRIEQAKQKEISKLRASVEEYAEEREKAELERKRELSALKSELEKSNEELKRTNDEKTKMREELEKVNKALDL